MNEQAAVDVVKYIIKASSEKLTEGLFAGGSQVDLETVTSTVLMPPIGYYHIAINVTGVTSQSRPDGNQSQVARPLRQDIYTTQVWIAGQGMIEQGEENPYEAAHETFRLFTDRVAEVVERGAPRNDDPKVWMRDDTSGLLFQLARQPGTDRVITKTNEIVPFTQDQQFILIMLAILNFRLVCNCDVDGKLYPSVP